MMVSIIIPVFNVEKYLDQCIQSILGQGFRDYELLLVDDGSRDMSGEICDFYAEHNSRVKVFHRHNAGVSAARNFGLEQATGEWITFIDADDWIGSNYFECFNQKIDNDVDWIFLSIDRVSKSEIRSMFRFTPGLLTQTGFLDKYSLYTHFPGPCAKMYRAALVRNNGILFDEDLNFGEDAVFNVEYLNWVSMIHFSPVGVYYYRKVQGGLSENNTDYSRNSYFFSQIKKACNADPIRSYPHMLAYPLLLKFTSLYKEKSIKLKTKRKLLKEMITENYESFLHLYRDAPLRHFIKFSKTLNSYRLLNYYLNCKINDSR